MGVVEENEIKDINRSVDAIAEILLRFPKVVGAGKTFNFSPDEQPNLLRFICEGDEGGYIIELGLELLRDNNQHIDLMCSVIHAQILEQNILPNDDWKCYQFNSSYGLVEIELDIPRLSDRIAS